MQLITKYLPADYTDSFQKTISNESSIQVNDLFKLMFIEYPKWGLWLLKVRDLIVKPLGLKTNKTFIDLIIEENNEEIILGTDDKHLTFYISIYCSKNYNKRQSVSLTTIVKYNNLLGKIYFYIIWIFHRIVVKYLFKRAIRRWYKQRRALIK